MNKYQETYQRLTNHIYKYDHIEDVYKDLEILGELVDTATPKEPLSVAMTGYFKEEASHLVCPNCKQSIVNVWSHIEYKPKYCHYCGQSLDWSEDE